MSRKEKFVSDYRRGSVAETSLHLALSVALPFLAAAPLARLWVRIPHLPAWGCTCLTLGLTVALFLTFRRLSQRARTERAGRVMRELDAPGTRLTERDDRYVIQPHGFRLSRAEFKAVRASHVDDLGLARISFVPRFDGWRLPSALTLCGLLFVAWAVWYCRACLPLVGEVRGRLAKAVRSRFQVGR